MVRAAVLTGQEQLEVVDIEVPDPGPGELLVRLAATGVCHSDLHMYELGLPMTTVMGHEGAGTVEAVGPGVTDFAEGDHVILAAVPQCGTCRYCTGGQPTLCRELASARTRTRYSIDGKAVMQAAGIGTWSEASVVDARSAVKVDKAIPFPQASLIGCAVMTGYGAVVNTAGVQPGDTVAVIGCGGVGLNGVQGARIAGAARIVGIDMVDSKLQWAKQLGATDTINAKDTEDVPAAVMDLTGGEGVDVALDFVGAPSSGKQGLAMIRRGGQLVFTGFAASQFPMDVSDIIMNGKIVKGNYMGMGDFQKDFTDLVQLYGDGRLDLDTMVSRTIDLTEIIDAFRAMEAGEVARSVVVL